MRRATHRLFALFALFASLALFAFVACFALLGPTRKYDEGR